VGSAYDKIGAPGDQVPSTPRFTCQARIFPLDKPFWRGRDRADFSIPGSRPSIGIYTY